MINNNIDDKRLKFILDSVFNNTDFIYHVSKNDWGTEILIMEKHGFAFAETYWYNNDHDNIYLCWLSVIESQRKLGLGTKLQEIREEIGRKTGACASNLQVKIGSWMQQWYKKRGYIECNDIPIENDLLWMKKKL